METENMNGLELSTQILIKEAEARGIEVEVIDRSDNFIRLRKGDKAEYVKQATRTSVDSYIAPLIMENKDVTKFVLRENAVNVPDGITVVSIDEAMQAYTRFAGSEIVVKPKSTNFGVGVSILKEGWSRNNYAHAVNFAFQYDGAVMIETFIPGREYRFLVIGDETVAVLYRVPANVTGDGLHTISELVKEKNKDPLRGEGYVTPLEKIKLGEVEREFLRAQGKSFETVPSDGETVFLRENSNISTGGDSIDCTDDMPDYYKQVAVQAANAVGANICGADIIVPDLAAPAGEEHYCIIELNFNPALHIHDFPYRGKNRKVEKKVLDLLFTITNR